MLYISDHTLTTDNVAKVMAVVNDLESLAKVSFVTRDSIIPSPQLQAIQRKFTTKREVATECAYCFSHCHPLASWTLLATHLYKFEEFAAVEKVKPFLPLRGKHQVIS